jgi:hypothetical protein
VTEPRIPDRPHGPSLHCVPRGVGKQNADLFDRRLNAITGSRRT